MKPGAAYDREILNKYDNKRIKRVMNYDSASSDWKSWITDRGFSGIGGEDTADKAYDKAQEIAKDLFEQYGGLSFDRIEMEDKRAKRNSRL